MSSFSVEDIRMLEKTQSIKERMIDNLMGIGKELPVKPRDIDSYVNLLESAERTILGRAKINSEDTSNKIQEGTKEALTELLISLHKGAIPAPVEDVNRIDQVPTYVPQGLEVSDGSIIPKIDHVSLSDIEVE